ncbi:MAG TPA: 3-phosphoshikimate 1-carboxyvinyltransferase [Bacteroidales bacterium]|jgi:3-phosphoshikimate 1-carboxyvinyltransferase|nr:3-phosphoshikimate 1-carboxyvinyltransferase [Bacteroidales bacterium]HOS72862.1 3-phosphoshikimate 1-carboxyvinyltransferase [Bacteroidales bacterium]HQH22743.1 3-phosphoshikimate 1-carboxyvinyltransferase [Bacteroidales bacterium]HQJ83099.1 3-phosphoshikimate 1-carboxyvinyltransferase [Bacteroidales bacterium]
MDYFVVPSEISGSVTAPPSKSMTQRAIAAALLAKGESIITNPSDCDDSLAAINIARALGADVTREPGILRISGAGKIREQLLNCGESGLAIRMFSPVAALNVEEIIMTGTGSLVKRPMSIIEDALRQFGVKCKSEGGFLPLTIQGPLRGGHCEIDGSLSSQLLTGLLMALPVTEKDSIIIVNNLKSKPYIDMTLQVLKSFGINILKTGYSRFEIPGNQKYKAGKFEVEGDWSGGAFLLVAGAINGDIRIEGLRADSLQSDKAILNVLDSAGVRTTILENSITVRKSPLKAFFFDATESPDLFPPLVTLAAFCRGKSTIKGVSRLIHKESNRAEALITEFGRIGIRIETSDDNMIVSGGSVKGGEVSSHGDHRIAMAAAVAALGSSGKILIKNSGCVAKSWPLFFEQLRRLGTMIWE